MPPKAGSFRENGRGERIKPDSIYCLRDALRRAHSSPGPGLHAARGSKESCFAAYSAFHVPKEPRMLAPPERTEVAPKVPAAVVGNSV